MGQLHSHLSLLALSLLLLPQIKQWLLLLQVSRRVQRHLLTQENRVSQLQYQYLLRNDL